MAGNKNESLLKDFLEDKSLIMQMEKLQDRVFINCEEDLRDLESYERRHYEFMRNALERGFNLENEFDGKEKEIRGVEVENKKEMFNILREIKEKIKEMMQSKEKSDEELYGLALGLHDLYERVHGSNLGDQAKLFFEFYLGLCYVFRLTTLVNLRVVIKDEELPKGVRERALKMVRHLEDVKDEWEHLQRCKEATVLIQQLFFVGKNLQLEKEEVNQVWEKLKQRVQKHYELNATLEYLCSLRYFPKVKKFLALAQILHWKGFGNMADWLPSIQDPYVEKLIYFRDLSIRYHSHQEITHFSGQHILKNMFGTILAQITQIFNICLRKSFEECRQQFPAGKTHIIDVGSGPEAAAVKILLDPFKDDIIFTASDVCCSALLNLLRNNIASKVIYQDLNYLDSWKPNHALFSNKFHIMSMKNVLHQCMDDVLALQSNCSSFMRFVTDVLMPGGFFAWIDAGSVIYLQTSVIPGNMVDREGHVPINIYRYINSFADICLPLSEPNSFKALILIPSLLFATPHSCLLEGGIYIFKFFINVKLSLDEKNILNEKWTAMKEDNISEHEFLSILSDISIRKHPEFIKELQKATFDEYGKW